MTDLERQLIDLDASVFEPRSLTRIPEEVWIANKGEDVRVTGHPDTIEGRDFNLPEQLNGI